MSAGVWGNNGIQHILVHYCERGWDWAREQEGQKTNSLVLGSLGADLKVKGEQSSLRKGCWSNV